MFNVSLAESLAAFLCHSMICAKAVTDLVVVVVVVVTKLENAFPVENAVRAVVQGEVENMF